MILTTDRKVIAVAFNLINSVLYSLDISFQDLSFLFVTIFESSHILLKIPLCGTGMEVFA